MNLLDLSGPQFLLFYVIALPTVFGVAWLVRRNFLRPVGEPPEQALELTPTEVAYLAGGKKLAIKSAIARLLHLQLIEPGATARSVKFSGKPLPPDLPNIDRHLCKILEETGEATVSSLRASTEKMLSSIHLRLRNLGLLVADGLGKHLASWVPPILVASLAVLGLSKVVIGMLRSKPVVFLYVLVLITVFLMFRFFQTVHRSRRGELALVRLKQRHAPLADRLKHEVEGVSASDLVLAVSLFGMGALAPSVAAQLGSILGPAPGQGSTADHFSSGSDHSSSSDGDGGGGGGGGCGGCGSGD